MKLMTATVLLLTAISAPALAETPTQRDMHSWNYVQTTAAGSQMQPEAPVMQSHEQPYHHDAASHEGKHHHGHHHDGKHHTHHHDGKAKHHHHKKDAAKAKDKPAEQPKQ